MCSWAPDAQGDRPVGLRMVTVSLVREGDGWGKNGRGGGGEGVAGEMGNTNDGKTQAGRRFQKHKQIAND